MEQQEITKEITQEVTTLAGIADRAIIDQAGYNAAAETVKAAKALLKKVDSVFDPLIKQANDTVKGIRDQKKMQAEPVESVDTICRRRMTQWITAQEEAKRNEERRRAEEARAEEARLRAEQEAKKEFLADLGVEAASQAIIAVIPEAVAEIEKSGISYREVWRFEIQDAAAIPREYLSVNETAIGAAVRAQKEMAKIPGVRVYSEKTAIVK